MKIKNKIGYCSNKHLKGVQGNPNGGHYVIIRSINKNGTCDVNTFTSLEDSKGFKTNRIDHIKKGNIYPIPKYDANFPLWTGCTRKPIKNVKISHIKNIGKTKIKKRHLFFIGKFLNNKKR